MVEGAENKHRKKKHAKKKKSIELIVPIFEENGIIVPTFEESAECLFGVFFIHPIVDCLTKHFGRNFFIPSDRYCYTELKLKLIFHL